MSVKPWLPACFDDKMRLARSHLHDTAVGTAQSWPQAQIDHCGDNDASGGRYYRKYTWSCLLGTPS
jgi:hypothetical protein